MQNIHRKKQTKGNSRNKVYALEFFFDVIGTYSIKPVPFLSNCFYLFFTVLSTGINKRVNQEEISNNFCEDE